MLLSIYMGVSESLTLDPGGQFFLPSSLPPSELSCFSVAMVLHSTQEKGQKGEVFIAVIGVTGAGKTTFISRATGRTDLEIGYSIDCCKSHRNSSSGTTVRLLIPNRH